MKQYFIFPFLFLFLTIKADAQILNRNFKFVLISIDSLDYISKDTFIVQFIRFNDYKKGDLQKRSWRNYRNSKFFNGYIKIDSKKNTFNDSGVFASKIRAYYFYNKINDSIERIQWIVDDWREESFSDLYKSNVFHMLNSKGNLFLYSNIMIYKYESLLNPKNKHKVAQFYKIE